MRFYPLVPCLLVAGAALACSDSSPTRAVAESPVAALASVPGPGQVIPSGQRVFHQSTLEPVYDDEHAGAIGFVSTPMNAPLKANPKAWSPIYIVVYPTTSAVTTPLLCQDVPVENCPEHGPVIAGLAQQKEPGVYGAGVRGHDHLMDYPGGADFDVAWEPVVVLFTNSAAADHQLLTDAEIQAAVNAGDAIEVRLPSAAFHCAAVAPALWQRATPIS